MVWLLQKAFVISLSFFFVFSSFYYFLFSFGEAVMVVLFVTKMKKYLCVLAEHSWHCWCGNGVNINCNYDGVLDLWVPVMKDLSL